ncbi:MAG: Gfo/Idh/MocA family oxidoreductase [Victivallales bacterium]
MRSSADAGFTPELYSDWRQMLDRLSPALVAVDGPFDKHAEMAAYALERGIHVVCEKPIALTLTDLDRIMAAQKRSGCRIISMVGLRYQADFQYALQLVRAGAVGKVKMVRAQKSYRLGTRSGNYPAQRELRRHDPVGRKPRDRLDHGICRKRFPAGLCHTDSRR